MFLLAEVKEDGNDTVVRGNFATASLALSLSLPCCLASAFGPAVEETEAVLWAAVAAAVAAALRTEVTLTLG
jgi:hypothetical protein